MRGTQAKRLRRAAYQEFKATQDKDAGGFIFFLKRKTKEGQPVYEGQTLFYHPKSLKGIYRRMKRCFREGRRA